MTRRTVALAAVAALALAVSKSAPASAHYTVASKYTWTRDVLPILSARCGSCHVNGGVAANLLDYSAAKAAAWPIRQALMSGRMPPWNAEGVPVPFKGAQTLTANEFNTLMVWAAGGTPLGTAGPRTTAPRASHLAPRGEWPLGAPPIVVAMPAPFTLDAAVDHADGEVALQADAIRGKWIRVVDVSPGERSILRRAEVDLVTSHGRQTLAAWVAGDVPQPPDAGAAFHIPDDATLSLRLHYQQPPLARPTTRTDRTRVGFYTSVTPSPAAIETLQLSGDGEFPWGNDRVFTQTIEHRLRLVALRPISGPADATVQLSVVSTRGDRESLATLVLRAGWERSYVFASAIPLAPGDRIEARVEPSRGFLWASLTGDRTIGASEGGPLRLEFDAIARD